MLLQRHISLILYAPNFTYGEKKPLRIIWKKIEISELIRNINNKTECKYLRAKI